MMSTLIITVVTMMMMMMASEAFVVPTQSIKSSSPSTTTTELNAMSRRQMFQSAILAAGAAVSAAPPAEATYSAYTRREEDWEKRSKSGDITYVSARSLRAQLQEMVPQNSEGSKVFCPNGPSASVSPLMENKCSDRLAMPSVYGRTEDTVGNSIPGFNGGYYPGGAVQAGSLGLANNPNVGGFPKY